MYFIPHVDISSGGGVLVLEVAFVCRVVGAEADHQGGSTVGPGVAEGLWLVDPVCPLIQGVALVGVW